MLQRLSTAVVGALLMAPATVGAQTSAWGPNGYISINGLYQGNPKTWDNQVTVPIENENGQISSRQRIEPGPAFDLTMGGRLKGHLGVGFGASYYRRDSSAAVTASLPHPLYFNQPRRVAGSTDGLTRKELVGHLHLMWQFPFSDRVQVTVFGGPSYFSVKQLMVENVDYSESYPYDEARFTSAEAVQRRGSRVGYNAGADVTFFFSRYVGVGALVRVSSATVRLSTDDGAASVEAGGTQVGTGARFRF